MKCKVGIERAFLCKSELRSPLFSSDQAGAVSVLSGCPTVSKQSNMESGLASNMEPGLASNMELGLTCNMESGLASNMEPGLASNIEPDLASKVEVAGIDKFSVIMSSLTTIIYMYTSGD